MPVQGLVRVCNSVALDTYWGYTKRMERYVVRDQSGNFMHDFTSAADRFATDGSTARERALDWADLQTTPALRLSVWREDIATVHTSIKPILVRAAD